MNSRSEVLSLDEHVEERSRVARRDRAIWSGCLAVAAICLVLAALILPGIQKQRRELQLVVGENAFDDMPPGIALPTAMLSTFRGLMIHYLWTRGESLKQDGKYFELQQLSDWICSLQPRYPKVWANAAWNMAYNISVGTYSERERWYWVYGGACLLRDKGIVFNPTALDLYKELSWIYLHKMGDFMDDCHWGYKRNWAVIMERILGEPPSEPDVDEAIAPIRAIAEAAREIRRFDILSKPEALQMYIDSDSQSPSMREFADRLAAAGHQPGAGWLEAVARSNRIGALERELRAEQLPPDDPVALFQILMSDEKLAPARDRLLAAVRAHVLAGELRIDPEYMLQLMERFGPFDWRSVYSHGLYWAAMGADKCKEDIGKDENVEMNTHRLIQFGLKDTCERGRVVLEPDFDDPFASMIQILPDYTLFADKIHQFYLEDAEVVRGGEDPREYYKEGPAGRLYKSGHVNFLQTVVRRFYLEGRIERARKYYDYLRENYREPDGRTKEIYLVPLEEYALQEYYEAIDSFKQGPVVITTMLESSFFHLAVGRSREAAQRMLFAQKGHERFMQSKLLDRTERRRIPPWPQFRAGALQNWLLNYPLPARFNLVYKARVWAQTDLPTQLEIFRAIKGPLEEMCSKNDPPLDPERAFPPPPGLEEYEARRAAEQKDQPEEPDSVRDVEVDEGAKR